MDYILNVRERKAIPWGFDAIWVEGSTLLREREEECIVDRKQFFLSYIKFHLPFGYPRKNVSWYDFWNSELSAMSIQYRSL